MARASTTVCVVLALLVAASSVRHAEAGDVFERALKAAPAQTRVGAYTWIEECGIGVKLAPAQLSQGWPRLLAGHVPDQGVASALWELGPEGIAALAASFSAAKAEAASAHDFRPRGRADDIAGAWQLFDHADGRTTGVLSFASAGRNYALAFTADARQRPDLAYHRDGFVRDFVMLPDVDEGSVTPLLLEGRYSCLLRGWRRVGERFYARAAGGWIGLRIFQVAAGDFPSLDALWAFVEGELTGAGFKQAFGSRPVVAGSPAFMREYFRTDDGYVQRILYARLEGGYIVALMQAPQILREQLEAQSTRFAASIAPLELGGPAEPVSRPFSDVRNVRCVAWLEERRILWGTLFDDARREQVAWRQDGVAWSIKATRAGETVTQRSGTSNSSRALNPLVDPAARALDLDGDWIGRVEIELEVGGVRSSASVTVR